MAREKVIAMVSDELVARVSDDEDETPDFRWGSPENWQCAESRK